MKSKLLGIVISMLCATSFLAANSAADAKAEKAPVVATGNADVKPEAAEGAKKEVANADEVAKAEDAKAKAKKAEEKLAQDKKSCSGCK